MSGFDKVVGSYEKVMAGLQDDKAVSLISVLKGSASFNLRPASIVLRFGLEGITR